MTVNLLVWHDFQEVKNRATSDPKFADALNSALDAQAQHPHMSVDHIQVGIPTDFRETDIEVVIPMPKSRQSGVEANSFCIVSGESNYITILEAPNQILLKLHACGLETTQIKTVKNCEAYANTGIVKDVVERRDKSMWKGGKKRTYIEFNSGHMFGVSGSIKEVRRLFFGS